MVSRLDDDERARFLRGRAVQWQKEIRLLAVLLGTSPQETRANIRALDERIDNELPNNPLSPVELRDHLGAYFEPNLAGRISSDLVATVDAPPPDLERLLEWADIDPASLERVRNALDEPRRERVRRLNQDRHRLRQEKIRPSTPTALQPPRPSEDEPKQKPKPGPTTVRAVKVDERHDQRKRELGDEGERWALAAVIDVLMGLDDDARNASIDQVKSLLLKQFTGKPVNRALVHAERACLRNLDDEERIEELSGFLWLSRYSDAFGFDLIGWLPSDSPDDGQAICMEVKSSSGERFQLSRNEWSVAKKFRSDERGDQYAILVVRRRKAGGVPRSMDLLRDPVALVEKNLPKMDADGYQITYKAGSL